MNTHRDNESFLKTAACRKEARKCKVTFWHIPPRSPDLSPVEKFWGWLRKRLRKMGREDLRAKRPPITKAQYKRRVQDVLRTGQANRVAKNCYTGLRKVCQKVLSNKGAHSGT